MIDKYIGLPYCLHNINGVNCWGLVAKVYADRGHKLHDYALQGDDTRAIATAFTSAFATGAQGFRQIEQPSDWCVVVMKNRFIYHCGLWYKGKVIHANTVAKQVIMQPLQQAAKDFKQVEFWALK